MSRETIYINKAQIPYYFDITLCNDVFTFTVDYNSVGKFFTIGLAKNGVTLCQGAPIMYGRKLFEDIRDPEFPAVDIIPYDPSGSYNKVTYNNLCEAVLLILDNGETPVLGG